MSESFTKEEFWDTLEARGEEHVRMCLALGVYGESSLRNDKRMLAEEWLRKKDQGRIDRYHAENVQIQRSAKNAAWISAIAAIAAAICAVIVIFL